jgi:hypothetical protein
MTREARIMSGIILITVRICSSALADESPESSCWSPSCLKQCANYPATHNIDSDTNTRTGGRADPLVSVFTCLDKNLTGLSRSQFGTASITLCGAIVGTIFVSL